MYKISTDVTASNIENVSTSWGAIEPLGIGRFLVRGIRASISVAKSLSLTNNLDLYGFNSDQFLEKNHEKLIKLAYEGVLKKNLIKPNY